MQELRYSWLAENLAVCRLPANSALPPWLPPAGFTSVTRTVDELSIVCAASVVPADVQMERGWRALKVLGPLAFDAVGVLRQIASPLADAGIPIIAIGTFDTDYVLVQQRQVAEADRVLGAAGVVWAVDA